ncbi:protein kinase [Cadophora sp. DSE1049]|nr:protein kinase [Cadophora sp. DSE1049]
MATFTRQYQPSALDDVEEIENYRPAGLHPIHIGDEVGGRYRVVHKLGYGGSSTVWLARDKLAKRYVALKILEASIRQECRDLAVLQALAKASMSQPGRSSVVSLLDHFVIEGRNGRHVCLVLPAAGPSITSLNYSPGIVAGSRRLKSQLTLTIAKQTIQALEFVHSQGFCHGDLTASNVLFQLNDCIDGWSQEEIYECLGQPRKDAIMTISGSAPGESALKYIVEPCSFPDLQFLCGDILLVDFGCAFSSHKPPSNPDDIGLTMSYAAPEVIFESNVSVYSDIWALGCVLFEIRSGRQLFGNWIGSKDDVLRQLVQAFGKLPEPWWTAWETREDYYFDDDGDPRKIWVDGIVRASKFGLDEMIAEIGYADEEEDVPENNSAEMLEPNRTNIPAEEASHMNDLLRRILKWKPEERISVKEILSHSWLS